jgi:hypothetical protein
MDLYVYTGASQSARSLVQGPGNLTPFTPPTFFNGDVIPIRLAFVNDTTFETWSGVTGTPTLELGQLNVADPILASVASWTPCIIGSGSTPNAWSGVLNLNTTALADVLSGQTNKSVTLEISLQSGSTETTYYQGSQLVQQDLHAAAEESSGGSSSGSSGSGSSTVTVAPVSIEAIMQAGPLSPSLFALPSIVIPLLNLPATPPSPLKSPCFYLDSSGNWWNAPAAGSTGSALELTSSGASGNPIVAACNYGSKIYALDNTGLVYWADAYATPGTLTWANWSTASLPSGSACLAYNPANSTIVSAYATGTSDYSTSAGTVTTAATYSVLTPTAVTTTNVLSQLAALPNNGWAPNNVDGIILSGTTPLILWDNWANWTGYGTPLLTTVTGSTPTLTAVTVPLNAGATGAQGGLISNFTDAAATVQGPGYLVQINYVEDGAGVLFGTSTPLVSSGGTVTLGTLKNLGATFLPDRGTINAASDIVANESGFYGYGGEAYVSLSTGLPAYGVNAVPLTLLTNGVAGALFDDLEDVSWLAFWSGSGGTGYGPVVITVGPVGFDAVSTPLQFEVTTANTASNPLIVPIPQGRTLPLSLVTVNFTSGPDGTQTLMMGYLY